MKRRKHIVEESVDNIIVSQEITYPPASIIHALYYYIVLFRCGGPPPRRGGVAAACPAIGVSCRASHWRKAKRSSPII